MSQTGYLKKEKIFLRRNGFIIEFPKINSSFFVYVFKKITSFLIDISIFILLQFLLYYIFRVGIFGSIFIPFSTFLAYNILAIFILKNKTIGMFISRLTIVNYDGKNVELPKKIIRIIIYSLYGIPILGWAISILSFVTMFLTRGTTFVDIISKTQVVSLNYSIKIKNIYENIK